MLTKHTHKSITWIDLQSPTKEEVRAIMEEYNIHPLVANELLLPTIRPRVDVYNKFIYLILHFPTIIHSHHSKTDQEIDFIIGKDFIITTHYGVVDTLNEFSKFFEVNSILTKDETGAHAGFVFFYMIRHLYQHIADELDNMNRALTNIENNIFKGQEHAMVKEISKVSRKLIDFKKATRPHREILESFEVAGKKLFGDDFSYYLGAISAEHYQISVTLENSIETLDEMRITNDSLLNTKTTDIMRVLTIMAFVTFPLMLVSSVFGMNTSFMPIVGTPNDFWVIISIMLVATAGFFAFFKYKKWL